MLKLLKAIFNSNENDLNMASIMTFVDLHTSELFAANLYFRMLDFDEDDVYLTYFETIALVQYAVSFVSTKKAHYPDLDIYKKLVKSDG